MQPLVKNPRKNAARETAARNRTTRRYVAVAGTLFALVSLSIAAILILNPPRASRAAQPQPRAGQQPR